MVGWTVVVAAAVIAKPLEAPITAVTVFSDRARVTRTANVPASTSQAELPLLLDNVDPSSLRVESTGAEVKRVDIAHVDAEDFPADEARRLLGEMERVEDARRLASGERDVYDAVLSTVRALAPATPAVEPLKPAPKLNASGWVSALGFTEDWAGRMQGKKREVTERLGELDRQLDTLREKAAALGGARRRSGYRVTVALSGEQAARLSVTYTVAGARWYPTYDLQLRPERGAVDVSFYGRVSQETGEDWTHAALTLSTAIPASTTQLPKLLTWKIGQKDRFIPTPPPLRELVRPAPSANPEPAPAEHERDSLKRRLLSQLGDGQKRETRPRAQDAKKPASSGFAQPEESNAGDKEDDGDGVEGGMNAPPPPPAPTPPHLMMSAPGTLSEDTVAVRGRPPSVTVGQDFVQTLALTSRSSRKPELPPTAMSLSPPGGYLAPQLPLDLPASRAGGYSLSYDSLRPETVPTGKSTVVALFTQTWPVSVERKLYPGITENAFLVAEMKNPSAEPLPGGHANLFVGTDPSGVAELKLVSPQESFTLPLGIDRAIKPIRNVKVVESEKGLIGKDDASEYAVTIEVANPYGIPLQTRILDQWPLTDDKNVTVSLLKTEPYAEQDKVKGTLEWRVSVPPHGKTTVAFNYSLRRPKGWRLHQ
jgi:hypothetical protein